MLWPARWLGRPTSPRRCFAPTGAPVYYRACPARSLLQAKSVITTRPNHLLPRRDFHPLACQRTKAAPEGREGNEEPHAAAATSGKLLPPGGVGEAEKWRQEDQTGVGS